VSVFRADSCPWQQHRLELIALARQALAFRAARWEKRLAALPHWALRLAPKP